MLVVGKVGVCGEGVFVGWIVAVVAGVVVFVGGGGVVFAAGGGTHMVKSI